MSSDTAGSLWRFASDLYAYDTIKKQCMKLQHENQVNTNIVLWLCWLDVHKMRVAKSELASAQQLVTNSGEEALGFLRQARYLIKQQENFTKVQESSICKQILSAELAMEKICIARLQDYSQKLPELDDTEEALTLFDYLNDKGVEFCGQIAALLLEQARLYQESYAEPVSAY